MARGPPVRAGCCLSWDIDLQRPRIRGRTPDRAVDPDTAGPGMGWPAPPGAACCRRRRQPVPAPRHSPAWGGPRQRGNGPSGRRVGPSVQRWTNGVKTAVLLGLMGGLILLAGSLIGGRSGLLIALEIGRAHV